jgi:O-antigen/teichoic acid export membrane protein
MSEGRRFARSGAVVFAGTTLGQVAQLALLTLLAHRTSVSDLGVLLAVIGVLSIVVDVVDFGTASRLVREGAAARVHEAEAAAYFTSRTTTGVAAALTTALAGLLVEGRAGAALLWLAPWVALRVASQARRALLQMRSLFTAMAQVQLLDRVVSALVGGAILLADGRPEVAIGVAYAAGSLVALAAGHLIDRMPLFAPDAMTGVQDSYRGGLSFGVTLVITDLLSLDLIVLAAVAGAHEAGLFALASRVAIPVTTMASSLAAVGLARLAAQPDDDTAWKLLVAGTRLAAALTTAGLVVGIALAGPLLHVLGGSSYEGGTTALRLVLAACILSVLSQLMLSFLQSRGHESFAAKVLVPSIALSLVGVAVGGAAAGASGASIGFMLCNLVIVAAFAAKVRMLLRR